MMTFKILTTAFLITISLPVLAQKTIHAAIEIPSRGNFGGYVVSYMDVKKSSKEQMKMDVMKIYSYPEHPAAGYTLFIYAKNSPALTLFPKEQMKGAIMKIYTYPEYYVVRYAKNRCASILSPKEQMKTVVMRM